MTWRPQSTFQSDDRGGYANVEAFIERFNATSDTPITEAKEVDNIADKDSGYYRTEYRLGAFKDAVGVVGQIEGYGQIDIVSYGSTGYTDVRVYADVQNKEQAAVMFESLAMFLYLERTGIISPRAWRTSNVIYEQPKFVSRHRVFCFISL